MKIKDDFLLLLTGIFFSVVCWAMWKYLPDWVMIAFILFVAIGTFFQNFKKRKKIQK